MLLARQVSNLSFFVARKNREVAMQPLYIDYWLEDVKLQTTNHAAIIAGNHYRCRAWAAR